MLCGVQKEKPVMSIKRFTVVFLWDQVAVVQLSRLAAHTRTAWNGRPLTEFVILFGVVGQIKSRHQVHTTLSSCVISLPVLQFMQGCSFC